MAAYGAVDSAAESHPKMLKSADVNLNVTVSLEPILNANVQHSLVFFV